MRVVFAACSAGKNQLISCKARNLLGTQLNKSEMKDCVKIAEAVGDCTMIVDSGAFSAWNRGETIDIDKYIAFCHEFFAMNAQKFTELNFVNLDVIPGKQGQTITRELSEEAAKMSLQNYHYMKDKGVKNIIPVYHQGEDIDWLKRILDTGADYIGVSPSNDKTTEQRAVWLDYVFKYVPSHVRTHGFAVTSWRLMKWYPWFSVDSITYKFQAGMGSFKLFDGEETYQYNLSEHKDDIPKDQSHRDRIEELLRELHPDFSLESIRNSKTGHRCMVNIYTLFKMEESINKLGHLNRHLQQVELF